jgi:glutamine amidotransferase
MQIYFQKSEEGKGEGLTVFQGENVRLPDSVKVPHIGWNNLKIIRPNRFTEGLNNDSYVYFVHSCYPIPKNKEIICAKTIYGATFPSIIADKNVFGTQFHPEKSGKVGVRILRNFRAIIKK